MDEDLDKLNRDELIAEVKKLRQGIQDLHCEKSSVNSDYLQEWSNGLGRCTLVISTLQLLHF